MTTLDFTAGTGTGTSLGAGDEPRPGRSWAEIKANIGLVDRAELTRRLGQVLQSARDRGTAHAACLVDAGSMVSVPEKDWNGRDGMRYRIAGAIRRRVRASDTVAVLEDRCFALMLKHCPLDKAVEIAQSILGTLLETAPAVGSGVGFRLAPVVGVVPFTGEPESVEQILVATREACSTAQALGGSQVQVFRSREHDPDLQRSETVRATEVLAALEEERFQLYGQPIVPLRQRELWPVHYEILLRMLDHRGEIMLPASFILAAERFDMMAALDRWVIRNALRKYAEVFGNGPRVGLSINLSGRTLEDDTMLDFVRQTLAESDVKNEQVCFEITETAAIRDLTRARSFITELRASGCRFALDDFGSGHSSFTYLKSLPVNYLKIDGSFVRGILKEPFDRALVDAIRQLGQDLGIRIVAEWVEDEATLAELTRLGIDYAQGFAVGRPQPLARFA